jgi:hypothetical protein
MLGRIDLMSSFKFDYCIHVSYAFSHPSLLRFQLARVTELEVITTPHVQLVKHAERSAAPARVEARFEELRAPLADLFPMHFIIHVIHALHSDRST